MNDDPYLSVQTIGHQVSNVDSRHGPIDVVCESKNQFGYRVSSSNLKSFGLISSMIMFGSILTSYGQSTFDVFGEPRGRTGIFVSQGTELSAFSIDSATSLFGFFDGLQAGDVIYGVGETPAQMARVHGEIDRLIGPARSWCLLDVRRTGRRPMLVPVCRLPLESPIPANIGTSEDYLTVLHRIMSMYLRQSAYATQESAVEPDVVRKLSLLLKLEAVVVGNLVDKDLRELVHEAIYYDFALIVLEARAKGQGERIQRWFIGELSRIGQSQGKLGGIFEQLANAFVNEELFQSLQQKLRGSKTHSRWDIAVRKLAEKDATIRKWAKQPSATDPGYHFTVRGAEREPTDWNNASCSFDFSFRQDLGNVSSQPVRISLQNIKGFEYYLFSLDCPRDETVYARIEASSGTIGACLSHLKLFRTERFAWAASDQVDPRRGGVAIHNPEQDISAGKASLGILHVPLDNFIDDAPASGDIFVWGSKASANMLKRMRESPATIRLR